LAKFVFQGGCEAYRVQHQKEKAALLAAIWNIIVFYCCLNPELKHSLAVQDTLPYPNHQDQLVDSVD
jgi:hypothetical protein